VQVLEEVLGAGGQPQAAFDVARRAVHPVVRVALGRRGQAQSVEVGQAAAELRVGHHHEVPPLAVAAGRRLAGEPYALPDHLGFDRPGQVEASADGPGGGQQFVGGKGQRFRHGTCLSRVR